MFRSVVTFLCAGLLLALSACGGGGGGDDGGGSWVMASAPASTPGAGTGTTMSGPDAARAADAAEWVNGHRVANGLGTLSWNSTAAQVAYAHCMDMHVRSFFDHVNPSGQDPGDRLTAGGVGWSRWGENIGKNYLTGESVATGWMNSTGHRQNILNGAFTHMGLACYDAPSGRYWTLVFYTP